MNQPDYFFGYFFEPTITLKEDVFFAAWAFCCHAQLKKLHEELVIENEDGSFDSFQKMNFLDFSLLTFQERPDLVDVSSN
jgi:hypothetical protein